MELAATHPSGEQEWFCPTCGRRFLMQWPPSYHRTILEPGNESAFHTGGTGGLKMGRVETQHTNRDETPDTSLKLPDYLDEIELD